MTTNLSWSLSDAIVASNWSRIELAQAWGVSEAEMAEVQQKINRALEDESIDENEFTQICEKIDDEYGEALLA
jgi:hypothetical protein